MLRNSVNGGRFMRGWPMSFETTADVVEGELMQAYANRAPPLRDPGASPTVDRQARDDRSPSALPGTMTAAIWLVCLVVGILGLFLPILASICRQVRHRRRSKRYKSCRRKPRRRMQLNRKPTRSRR